ncbi:serine hydrolase [Rossellomorea sp. AcN35-11]|nr:class A beta-lactamase-related serine hydrolase [Rossellomorea aquimaris]WJV29494.1 serine hydrolase [Rossellomorea sp. AcN35-11]
MKIALFFIGACMVIGVIISVAVVRQSAGKDDPEYLLNHLKKNDNSSLTVRRNGVTLASIRADEMFPLASTVKIIVAIEYARQCEGNIIDPTQSVSLDELDSYYVPNTDGGAHDSWLAYSKERGLLLGNSTNLENVVKGMILFSSNANTEYMMDLLGVDAINRLLDEWEIEKHESVYPIVSAMLIPTHLKLENPSYTEATIEATLKEMSREEYIQLSHDILKALKSGQKQTYIDQLHTNEPLQKIWSDRLTRSTTAEYAAIMGKLNSKTSFPKHTQQGLDAVLEGLMESPKNREWLQHAGQKGGSTTFLVTNAAYATDLDGNATEIAIFTNNLQKGEGRKISKHLNGFILSILRDEDFREKLEEL